MAETKPRVQVVVRAVGRAVERKDVRVTLIGAGLLVLLIAAAGPLWLLQPVRFVLGLAFVLAAPGYWLAAALFPGSDEIDDFERLALTIGLSVAWISVLALILDWLPWGLRLWPILGGETASMLLFMAVALWRRGRLPAERVFSPDWQWRPRAWWRSLEPFERRLLKVAGVAVLVAGLVAAQVLLIPSPAEFTTEFYMLGAEGLAESYPREAAVGEEIGVTLGVRNHERGERTYRVEVWAVDGMDGGPEAGRRQLVAQDGPYTLENGNGREWPITWTMPWAGDDQVVELLLFDGDGTEPYRSLRLWLNVTE